MVLTDDLHTIGSLLCTPTNATPQERMFTETISMWNIDTFLVNASGKLFKKHYVKASKYDSDVEEVELLNANPQYAHMKLSDGRETTVLLRHLAPHGDNMHFVEYSQPSKAVDQLTEVNNLESPDAPEEPQEIIETELVQSENLPDSDPPLRHSKRSIHAPVKLDL